MGVTARVLLAREKSSISMRIGSLFAGIGGLELGLEMAGVGKTVWQVEKEPYCLKTLAKHWPDALRFEDVRSVGLHNLSYVDVICGGFPCTDISVAGKQRGITGPESGLWFEFARIVRELRPQFVVVENVRALLTHGLDTVLGEMARCGYDAQWSVLSGADVGAPHSRERVFIIAWREWEPIYGLEDFTTCELCDDWFCPRCLEHASTCPCFTEGQLACSDDWEGREKPWGYVAYPRRERGCLRIAAREYAVYADPRSQIMGMGCERSHHWAVEPSVDRLVDGVPGRLAGLKALGNAVIPQCAEQIGKRLLQIDAGLQVQP